MKSNKMTLQELKSLFGDYVPYKVRPRRATKKGFKHTHKEVWLPSKPKYPPSIRRNQGVESNLIMLRKSKDVVKKHVARGALRTECLYGCGNYVQPPDNVVCRTCWRREHHRALKLKTRTAPSLTTERKRTHANHKSLLV